MLIYRNVFGEFEIEINSLVLMCLLKKGVDGELGRESFPPWLPKGGSNVWQGMAHAYLAINNWMLISLNRAAIFKQRHHVPEKQSPFL